MSDVPDNYLIDPPRVALKPPGPITVYTDGSYHDGKGGWAYVVDANQFDESSPDPEWQGASGSECPSTNNRMELMAALRAIADHADVPLRIVSDSAYVVNCFLERWYDRWRVNGWVSAKKKPVENRDLWEELLAHIESRHSSVEWVHIRGHNRLNSRGERPDPAHVDGNHRADQIAYRARQTIS